MNQYSSALLASMTAAANGGAGLAALANGSAAGLAALTNGVGGGGGSGGGGAAAGSGVRRTEVPGLPKGWIREEIPRFDAASFLNGLGSGSPAEVAAAAAAAASAKPEVIYYSPKGHRARTKAEMSRLLGDAYDLTAFDFQTGKINPLLLGSLGSVSAAQLAAAAAAVGNLGGAVGGVGSNTTTSSSSSRNSHSSRSHHGNGHHHGGGSHQSSRKQSSTNHVGGRSTNGPSSHHTTAKAIPVPAPIIHHPPPPPPPPPKPDPSLIPPIRQTASIFKQPVTLRKNPEKEPDSEEGDKENGDVEGSGKSKGKESSAPPDAKKPKTDSNSSKFLDKPRQLFWEKRLSGIRASYPDEEDGLESFRLPSVLKPVGPPGVDEKGSGEVMVLASISTSLHLSGGSGAAGSGAAAAASGGAAAGKGGASASAAAANDLPSTEIKGQTNSKVSNLSKTHARPVSL